MSCVAQFFQTWGAMIQTIALIATLIVLAATLIVLIFYTVFTYQLRRATVKQTELSLRPFVMIFDDQSFLKYKNSGLSPALNIEIEPFEYKGVIVDFEKESVLSEKEVSRTSIDIFFRNKKTGKNIERAKARVGRPITPYQLKVDGSSDVHYLTIRYKNLEAIKYQTRVKISRKGIEFLATEKIS